MKHTTYVYLEKDDEDDPTHVSLHSLVKNEADYWKFEHDNAGTPDLWQKNMRELPDGFYRLIFWTTWDQEFLDGHPITERYRILDTEKGFVLDPSPLTARGVYWVDRFQSFGQKVVDPFLPVWAVEETDKGEHIGHGKYDLYLPQALLLRIKGLGEDSWFKEPKLRLVKR